MSLVFMSPKLEAIALNAKYLITSGEGVYNVILFYFILEYRLNRKNIFLIIKYLDLFKAQETKFIIDGAIGDRNKVLVRLKYFYKIFFCKKYKEICYNETQSMSYYGIELSNVDFGEHLNDLELFRKIDKCKNNGYLLYREMLCHLVKNGDQFNISKALSLANIENIKIKTLVHDLYIDKNRRWAKLRCLVALQMK